MAGPLHHRCAMVPLPVPGRNFRSENPQELLALLPALLISLPTMAGAALRGQEQADWIRQRLEERLGSPVTSIDFRDAVPIRDRISAGPELLDALAPALGVLLRERVA